MCWLQARGQAAVGTGLGTWGWLCGLPGVCSAELFTAEGQHKLLGKREENKKQNTAATACSTAPVGFIYSREMCAEFGCGYMFFLPLVDHILPAHT